MILILGDIMIDRYYYGNMERISPEAPIPISNINNIEDKLGGAANLAINLNILYDKNIFLISVIGNDHNGEKIKLLLNNNEIKHKLYIDEERKTTIKNRIYCSNKMTSRFDIETKKDINLEIQNQIIDDIDNMIKKIQIKALVISDYDKGFVTTVFCKNVIEKANNYRIPVFVDPKVKDIEKYQNCFLLKPNLQEIKMLSNKTDLDEIIIDVYQKIRCLFLLVTCGSDGLILYSSDLKKHVQHKNEINQNSVDVTGAGDTVMAVVVSEYLKNNKLNEAIEIANYIAGKSVKNIGTYICNKEDIEEYTKKYYGEIKIEQNIFIFENRNLYLNEIIKRIRTNNKSIVFTNGCFDIIHLGHLKLLKYCKSLGDYLIVGLNSDSSIKRLKGNDRPFNNQTYRSNFLACLDIVDIIIIFNEDTPLKLCEYLKPKIMVKGSDYNIENIIGKEHCEEVKIFNFIDNYSTTNIIKNIKDKF